MVICPPPKGMFMFVLFLSAVSFTMFSVYYGALQFQAEHFTDASYPPSVLRDDLFLRQNPLLAIDHEKNEEEPNEDFPNGSKPKSGQKGDEVFQETGAL